MKKYLIVVALSAAACAPALAEPSVLEIGFKPKEQVKPVEPEAVAPADVAEVPANVVEASTNVVAKAGKKKPVGRPARITSDSTVYNRKEGIVSFNGHVHVDDEQYQMHADRVFLFLEKEAGATNKVHRAKGGTNDVHRAKGDMNDAGELKRIVALGNVAMTNEMRRAYGAKATYSKKNGLVILYSGDGITAEVRDESKSQVVRGKRIRFWIGTEQVEVDEADLTGPASSGGADAIKKALGK
jgi:lipopolysaccharide export system protein LptA